MDIRTSRARRHPVKWQHLTWIAPHDLRASSVRPVKHAVPPKSTPESLRTAPRSGGEGFQRGQTNGHTLL